MQMIANKTCGDAVFFIGDPNKIMSCLTLIKMALLAPDVEWPKKGVSLQCLLSSWSKNF